MQRAGGRDRGRPAEHPRADEPRELLPALDGRSSGRDLAGLHAGWHRAEVRVHGRDGADVCGLSGGPGLRAADARPMGDRGDRCGARDLPAGPAAGADGRLQLHQLRAHGGRAPSQPLHDHPDRRAPHRSQLRAEQLAPVAQPLWTAVHAVDVRRGPPGGRRIVLGAQGHSRPGQPGDDLPGLEVRAAAGPRPGRRDRARGPEPNRAGLGAGRRPQRLPHGLLHRAGLLPAAERPPARERGTAAPPARVRGPPAGGMGGGRDGCSRSPRWRSGRAPRL